jgi:hypothetical protein
MLLHSRVTTDLQNHVYANILALASQNMFYIPVTAATVKFLLIKILRKIIFL